MVAECLDPADSCDSQVHAERERHGLQPIWQDEGHLRLGLVSWTLAFLLDT